MLSVNKCLKSPVFNTFSVNSLSYICGFYVWAYQQQPSMWKPISGHSTIVSSVDIWVPVTQLYNEASILRGIYHRTTIIGVHSMFSKLSQESVFSVFRYTHCTFNFGTTANPPKKTQRKYDIKFYKSFILCFIQFFKRGFVLAVISHYLY